MVYDYMGCLREECKQCKYLGEDAITTEDDDIPIDSCWHNPSGDINGEQEHCEYYEVRDV